MAASEVKIVGTVEEGVGALPTELHPAEKARLTLAYVLLGGVVAILVLGGAAELLCPDNRLTQATGLFDFAKAFGPPIVTLVIGFYFRSVRP